MPLAQLLSLVGPHLYVHFFLAVSTHSTRYLYFATWGTLVSNKHVAVDKMLESTKWREVRVAVGDEKARLIHLLP